MLEKLEKRMREIMNLRKARISVGVSDKAAAPGPSSPSDLPTIAAILHEERPWIAAAAENKGAQWGAKLAPTVKAVAQGLSPKAALEKAAHQMVEDVKDSLTNGPWVPNEPETVRRKGSSKPLVDSGQLLESHVSMTVLPSGREVVVR